MLRIVCPQFDNNGSIPLTYTCDGANINPELKFSDIPDGTKELVLIIEDPDAPTGLWIHWMVWNINSRINIIPENSFPKDAIQGTNSFGENKYSGPCPPFGEHRYFFKLYALNTNLLLDLSATKEQLEKAMEGHIIEKAELMGLYARRG